MDVNLKIAFLGCKHVLPVMERQGGGSIVNISSIAGLRYIGKPQVAYSAGKAALMQLTQTTAVIYAPRGIRLNSVVPGLIFTPLVKRLADKYAEGDFEGFVAHRHNQVPIGRMGDAWDVAHAVLFLAADESGYITGAATRRRRRHHGGDEIAHDGAARHRRRPAGAAQPRAAGPCRCDEGSAALVALRSPEGRDGGRGDDPQPCSADYFLRNLRSAAICAAMAANSPCALARSMSLLALLHRLLGELLGLGGLGLVEVLAADRGVGEHRHRARLDFEDAAGDEDELLLAVVGALDAHRARPDAGDQRRVARQDAELAVLARQGDELRLAGEDLLLGGDDVDLQGCHAVLPSWTAAIRAVTRIS